MNLKNEFEYLFEDDLMYVKDQLDKRAEKITVKAPTNLVSNEALAIQQEVEKSQINLINSLKNLNEIMSKREENKTSNEDEKEKDIDIETILKHLMSGTDEKGLKRCMDSFKKILLYPSPYTMAYIDDSVKLDETMFNKMSLNDCKNILATYIQVFFYKIKKN